MNIRNRIKREIKRNRHLGIYFRRNQRIVGNPRYMKEVPGWEQFDKNFNIIYPVSDQVYVHAFKDPEGNKRYNVVEPQLNEELKQKLKLVKGKIYQEADYGEEINYREELRDMIKDIFKKVVGNKGGFFSRLSGDSIDVGKENIPTLRYYVIRDLVDYGILNPLLNDEYLEDIYCVGTKPITLIHKTFGMMKTNIGFDTEQELEEYIKKVSQRMGSPVGESHPIVDSALPDGSRINVVYPEDVSTKGRSFTIRKFPDDPISITQLIDWETITAELAAYLWLILENGMSMFVCGESACGKTTTLNAALPFIQLDSKIFSVEDTPEIKPPHDNWQQLIVREEGPKEDQVGMFDLLKAALRSRPEYIIPSEIRGKEGRVAFQAMQTGHPIASTFHSSSIHRMIQRLTGEPIEIPITFIDNLNVAVIQRNIKTEGAILRRVTEVGELVGYSEDQGGVMMRITFKRDPQKDELDFEGMYNSFILEDKIAQIHGYDDTRKIYDIMEDRAEVLQALTEKGITDFSKVTQLIDEYRKGGKENMSIKIR